MDVVWQDAVPSGTELPRDEICTGVRHLASTVSATYPGAAATNEPSWALLAAWPSCSAPLHAFPQLCAAVMGGLWVLTFPASRYRALVQPWCLSSWSAAHRPTGFPSPFHPIRLMLAGPAQTRSELGRFNAPSPSSRLPSFVLHQRGDGAEMEESEGVGLHEASSWPEASSSRQHQHQRQRQHLSARTMLASTFCTVQ